MESGDTMDQFCSSLFSNSSLSQRPWHSASETNPKSFFGFPPPYLTNALEHAAKASGFVCDQSKHANGADIPAEPDV